MFDLTLKAFTYGVEPMPEQHALLYHFSVGIILPAQGDQQPIIPLGLLRFHIPQPMAAEFQKEHEAALEKVPAPSKLQVVSNSQDIEAQAAAARQMERDLRGGDAA